MLKVEIRKIRLNEYKSSVVYQESNDTTTAPHNIANENRWFGWMIKHESLARQLRDAEH